MFPEIQIFMERNSGLLNRSGAEASTLACNIDEHVSRQSSSHCVEGHLQHLNSLHGNTPAQDFRCTTHEDIGHCQDGTATEFDEYLTNIKWLGQLSCSNLIPELKSNSPPVKSVKKCRSRSNERPPKSYSEIIQLAIHSTPTKQMTLRQIYRWVEDHFPYYRHCAKPGWRNSIRHTLSMRNVFVRLTGENERMTFWTVKTHHDSAHLQKEADELPSNLPSVKLPANLKKCIRGSQEREENGKRMKPILPRVSSVLIPVFIRPPVSSNTVAQPRQCTKKKPTPIAPKLPLMLLDSNIYVKDGLCAVNKSSVRKTTWNDAGAQSVVAKRWKGYRSHPPAPRRKKKYNLGPESQIRLSAFDKTVDTVKSINSSRTIKSSGVDVAFSPLKTPIKVSEVEGLATSTPCKAETSVLSPTSMLISLLSGLTPPKLEDTALDFSLIKTPRDGSPGYLSLGSPDNTAMMFGREDNHKDLCGLLGCTPLQGDSFIERPGADEPNESFSKMFSEFCTPNLGEGIDMANISWSYIYNQN